MFEPEKPKHIGSPNRQARDDEDDDQPRSKSAGGGKAAGIGGGLILIIIGIAVCCLCVPVSGGIVYIAVGRVRDAAARATTVNNLKQVGLGVVTYSDANRRLPPLRLQSGPGKVSDLSWRVSILPFIEQQALWQQIDKNVGWNHPNNARSANQQLPVFQNLTRPPVAPNETHFRFFTGPNTLFPEDVSKFGIGNIPDGSANTILVAEAADSVPWMKPAEITNGAQGLPKDRFLAVMADASVRSIERSRASDDVLRLLIDPNDQQPIPGGWDH